MLGELRLTLLGKPHASQDGIPVSSFVYNKSFGLLCYLVMTHRAHSREALAGLLWGEMSDEHARANLRKALKYLRDAVPECLVISRQAIAFDFGAAHWFDVEMFQSKLQGVRPAPQPAILNEGEARLLAEAVEVYAGDFMDGFYVHDAPAFEEWMATQRERLRQLALNALYSLAKYYTTRGAYTTGIDYATRLLALEPWHEEFHQQMMLLLALSGQRSAALRQYEVCRIMLEQELGVEPSGETLSLLRQIQLGQVSVPTPPPAPPHNLAAQVTPFIGREEELRLIDARLRQPECRLLTLVGIGGIGKTRLALQAACDALPAFADGVYLIDLCPADTAGHIVMAMAESLGAAGDGRPGDRPRLLAHLRSRRSLLVLDDLEPAPDTAQLLVEILGRAPGVKFLVTSPEPLGLPGEWVLPVKGLSYPKGQPLKDGENSSAVQLFLAGARRTRDDATMTDADMAAVIRICRLVQGLPLAIELAAAWTRVLSCEEIEREIEKSIDFLATTSLSVPERQRSLRAVFAAMWAQLDEAERGVYQGLSVFRGGFRREVAELIAGASLPILAALLDRGLLHGTSFGRYEIHELLRQYSAARLAEDADEEAAVRERHCAYYVEFAREREALLGVPSRASQARDDLLAEVENIQAARAWASERHVLPIDDGFPEEPRSRAGRSRRRVSRRAAARLLAAGRSPGAVRAAEASLPADLGAGASPDPNAAAPRQFGGTSDPGL